MSRAEGRVTGSDEVGEKKGVDHITIEDEDCKTNFYVGDCILMHSGDDDKPYVRRHPDLRPPENCV